MRSLSRLPVRIAGLGCYLPERVLSNHDLERMVDTSDEWIVQRTGISERRIAAPDQATSDLAIAAARAALQQADLSPEAVDAIIVCSCSPDYIFPATACLVQAEIGAENAAAYDLEAACSGFVFGMVQAGAMISSGLAQTVLVIGAETLSRFTDYRDRHSCILFGDGAGAAVVTGSDGASEILYCELGADGSQGSALIIPAGGARQPTSEETVAKGLHFMQLQGREVFKLAVSKLGELLLRVTEQTGISLDEIKLMIPHQSNGRIIRSVCERTGFPLEKAYMNIATVGNTSAASIPLALDQAIREGRVERGDLVLLMAFGGGLTWGSILLRY